MKATFLFAGTAAAVVDLRSQYFLATDTDMRPEAVAHSLVQVEDEWRMQAASFAECHATLTADADISACDTAPKAFQKSCATVVSAVVKASSGNRRTVKEYMDIVCGESELSGWHHDRCSELASSVVEAMQFDNYGNREYVNAASTCSGYWSKFVTEESARVDRERADREAAEKKATEERIEAEKKAAAEAAKEAAEAEKRRAKEEAEKKAAEAQRQADAAAAELKARKEEAERQAQEAKKKMEEAQAAAEAAARHHQEALANATEAVKKFNASKANLTHASTNVTAVKVDLNVSVNMTK